MGVIFLAPIADAGCGAYCAIRNCGHGVCTLQGNEKLCMCERCPLPSQAGLAGGGPPGMPQGGPPGGLPGMPQGGPPGGLPGMPQGRASGRASGNASREGLREGFRECLREGLREGFR
ncbi:hypothetical protein COOONC_17123 [Cooperia oncophora]